MKGDGSPAVRIGALVGLSQDRLASDDFGRDIGTRIDRLGTKGIVGCRSSADPSEHEVIFSDLVDVVSDSGLEVRDAGGDDGVLKMVSSSVGGAAEAAWSKA